MTIAETKLYERLAGLLAALLLSGGIGAGVMLSLPPLLPMDQLRLLRQEPIRVGVRALDDMARWYEEKLGFVQIADAATNASRPKVTMLYGPNVIELVLSEQAQTNQSPVTELLVEDVDAVTTELKERGVEVLEEPRFTKRRDLRVSRIRDPEGHPIELQQLL